jgi:hypothetical protein
VGLLGIPGGLFLFMSRQFDIIKDLEIEYDKQLDVNFDPGVDGLCDGETCRHSECECWNNFRQSVIRELSNEL